MTTSHTSEGTLAAVDYLTTADLAALTRTSPSTVRWWRHVGRGPRGFRLPQSRLVLYRREDVDAWIAMSEGIEQ